MAKSRIESVLNFQVFEQIVFDLRNFPNKPLPPDIKWLLQQGGISEAEIEKIKNTEPKYRRRYN